MFCFLWRPTLAARSVKAMQCHPEMLFFDPSDIVRAITFHLLDEGKARTIDRESSEAAVDKLSRRLSHLAIPAERWATMNNAQRLDWLLVQSHIVVKSASSLPARLIVRRWPTLVSTTELLLGRL